MQGSLQAGNRFYHSWVMTRHISVAHWIVAAGALASACFSACAQTSAFSYQGQLQDSARPATGNYDLLFTLKDAVTNGNIVGTQVYIPAVPVTNGLFLVTLDFGAGVFNGQNLWLEMGIRTNGNTGPFVKLNPSQALAATPYATFSRNAAAAGLASNLVAGVAIAGNGAGITNLNGSHIVPGTVTTNQLDAVTAAGVQSGTDVGLAFSTPQQFGAKGDGVTDDTAALQAWLADASVGKKTALLPPAPGGFYKITSELSVSNGLHLTGAGGAKHATSGPFTSASQIRQFTPAQNGIHLYRAIDSIHMDNVVISANAPGDYTNSGSGIYFDGGSPDSDCSILEQCLVMGFGIGVNAVSEADSSFRACSFGWNGTGIVINGVANNITLESCQLSYNYGSQVRALAADNLIIKGCDIAPQPGAQGVYCQNNVDMIMIGCRFEDYTTTNMLIATTTGNFWGATITLIGTRFYNYSHAARYALALTNCTPVTLLNVYFDIDLRNTDGYSMAVSALDTVARVHSMPIQPYLLVSGSQVISATATMNSDYSANPSFSQAFDSVTSDDALRTKAVAAPASGLTTNLLLKAGMRLSISNGIIVGVEQERR